MKKIGLLITLTLIFSVSFVKAAYIDEYPEAYKWAFKNGITTQPTIEKANMYGSITRIELSKMISNYAINVLNKKVDTSKKCQFSDVSDKLNSQYDLGVTKACQLGLMGQGISKFKPNDNVTRAEFGTILSRLLYGTKYNGGTPYYIRHINNLNIRGIMTNIKNPEKVNESRGNVMVMLKRSEELGDYKTPTFEELDDDAFQCYECYLDGCIFEGIPKKGFIIPYKDGYIGFDWKFDELVYRGIVYGGINGLIITYRKLDNPCEIAYETNIVFYYNFDYFDKFGCNLYYGNTKKRLESFNSEEKDIWKCQKQPEKYFYNLMIGKEKEEYFTAWIKAFQKNIYNNTYTSWESKFSNCLKNLSGENENKNTDIDDFINKFDAEKFETEIKENNDKEEKNRRFCIEEILK